MFDIKNMKHGDHPPKDTVAIVLCVIDTPIETS